MKRLFDVTGYDRFNKKNITVSIYGVRTNEDKNLYSKSVAEFLIHNGNEWMWVPCEWYKPIEK